MTDRSLSDDDDELLRGVREWLQRLVTEAGAKVVGAGYLFRENKGGPAADFDIEKGGRRYSVTVKPLPVSKD